METPDRPPGARKGAAVAAVGAVLIVAAAGCQPRKEGVTGGMSRAGVPAGAAKVQEVSGRAVYPVRQPGRIYLYNLTRGRTVGQYAVRSGQRFGVDARWGRATLDGYEVSWGKLKAGDTYEIYLLPDRAHPPAPEPRQAVTLPSQLSARRVLAITVAENER